ncbi:hypothetical protein predicted by Glimmer/Critica [Salmonella enterica subsp. enterica serovar Weltevreden str. 2007-60-3289-1]|nr:hypothetical protein predicted by Glimmer/Critica [Salmonella enterica subsp. enterica serovar Weltevreden str. 2007-60-3289-1]
MATTGYQHALPSPYLTTCVDKLTLLLPEMSPSD